MPELPSPGRFETHRREPPAPILAVDARGLHSSGIGRYLREVLGVLLRDTRFAGIELLGEPRALQDFLSHQDARMPVRVRSYPGSFYSIRSQLAWLGLRATRRLTADVFFFPHYSVPLVAFPSRSVVTVHDLTHFRVPDLFARGSRMAAGMVLQRAVGGAAQVLTGSEATRRDLAERMPRIARKVRVVPYGVGDVFHESPAPGPMPESIRSLRPFLLCVGNRKPHKNLVAAVEALALLRGEGSRLKLVVAGGSSHDGWKPVAERASALGVGDALVDLRDLSDHDLALLYRECEALLFPSLYEGFGLPVAEAMACGTPVIASDRASLPEVVGDAGLLVDPTSPAEFARGVRRLEREPGLRATLGHRGRERAAHFTWRETGRRTADLLYLVATDHEFH